jgi:DNA-binding MarR family transcriptional regulator
MNSYKSLEARIAEEINGLSPEAIKQAYNRAAELRKSYRDSFGKSEPDYIYEGLQSLQELAGTKPHTKQFLSRILGLDENCYLSLKQIITSNGSKISDLVEETKLTRTTVDVLVKRLSKRHLIEVEPHSSKRYYYYRPTPTVKQLLPLVEQLYTLSKERAKLMDMIVNSVLREPDNSAEQ